MSEKEQYIIRNMTKDEVESVAVEWAAKEGWNPGLHDTPCFYATDPKGFFVGLLGDEPISCISAVAYDQDFAFLGFYIVKPEHRGQGYGLKIWNAAIAYLQTQNIGLDGVVEQQANYKKSGFELTYSNIRYEGTAKLTTEQFPEVVPLSEVSFNDIAQYDTDLFPVPRPRFLQCWVKQPESLALAALQDGKVAGYSVIRKCRTGYKIGPLFADTKDVANKLFLALSNFVEPGTKIYLDTPEVNQAAVQLAESHGMQKVFGTARMYTKSQPDIDLNKVFGVTTFELG
jgi:GNAT superfamily N-acetyltransferase